MALSIDLLGGAAKTLTLAAPATPQVVLNPPGGVSWALFLNYEGLSGDGAGTDTAIPILQTSFDGVAWWDLASSALINGGVVAAVNELVEALTPVASARHAASDGAIAASTILQTALAALVRIKIKAVDANANAQWRINKAILYRYDYD